jgi:DNA invertase Pin-like site-specific DNA recombinase
MMKVGIYARVSTHDQQTLPLQLKAMRQYVKQRKWKLVLQVEEVGSGSKQRPKREELLKAARRREADAIVVWKLDRWGRFFPILSPHSPNCATSASHLSPSLKHSTSPHPQAGR